MKFYGSDALHGFCGVASKYCTPEQFGYHIGLKVSQRPFNIYFKVVNDTHTRAVTATQTYRDQTGEIITEQRNVFDMKPVAPQSHRCNESYQYGDLDYGSKCSCKVMIKFFEKFLV